MSNSMMGVFILGLALNLSASADSYKSANCEDSGFVYGAWQEIARLEPKIGSFLEEIAVSTGQTKGTYVMVTNCWVKWPTDEEGKSLQGDRTVVIDKVWIVDNVTQHKGMKIIYNFTKSEPVYDDDGGYTVQRTRKVAGFALCRTPKNCQELAIPFAAPPVPKEEFQLLNPGAAVTEKPVLVD